MTSIVKQVACFTTITEVKEDKFLIDASGVISEANLRKENDKVYVGLCDCEGKGTQQWSVE